MINRITEAVLATEVVRMHPLLKPALRRGWRTRDSLQFGVDPGRAVVLEPVDDATARFLRMLDGTRGPDLLRQEAAALGIGPQRVRRLLAQLRRGGVLDDADSAVELGEVIRRPDTLERLRPDLASLSVVHPEPGAAARRMADRRAIRVQVRGAGRVGASVAAVLSAAGVGTVDVVDGGTVEPWDAAPAGVGAAQVGERRESAARGAMRRAAPDPRPRPRTARAGPEPPLALVVLAPRDGLGAYAPDPAQAEALMAAGIPHLYAGVCEGTGVVGPLVLPGRTGCAGCLELHRARADPAWPRLLAQLRSGRPPGVPACDVALATAIAGLTAAHALAFLDGGGGRTATAGVAWGAEGRAAGAGAEGTGAAWTPEAGAAWSAVADVAGAAHDTPKAGGGEEGEGGGGPPAGIASVGARPPPPPPQPAPPPP
ncbi:ThiF family adenylyltransferase, partial [Streptantibioticus parmotrematis]